VFTKDPIDKTTDYNVPVTFTVIATGTEPITYQWQRGGADIVGATDASYTLAAPANADEGVAFSCNAVNVAGFTTSAGAYVTVIDPVITAQPPSARGFVAGTNGSIHVGVAGSEALTFQWYKNGLQVTDGGLISGALTDTIVFTGADSSLDGTYYLMVTSGDTATSTDCIISVSDPAITGNPVSVTVDPGQAAQFVVSAAGTSPFTYQWQKFDGVDWANIAQTAATLDFAAAQETDEGQYHCIVTNSKGSSTSGAAMLSVNDPPVIGTQPVSQTVDPTDTVTFAVVLSQGTSPVSYQWVKFADPIPGETDNSLKIAPVSEADEAAYKCLISNSAGSLETDSVFLTVNNPPTIEEPLVPDTITKNPAESVTFAVTAVGADPLSYLWLKDGSPIANATNATYTIAAVAESDEGVFTCSVSNSAGTKTGTNPVSPAMTLLVNDPVVITAPAFAETVEVNPGDPATFNVAFTGTAPFHFTWKKVGGGADLSSGDVSATPYVTAYGLLSAQVSDEGDYVCTVSNIVGAVDAPTFTLAVHHPPVITVQPISQTVNYGTPVSFTVDATGFEPISYQWYKNGVQRPEDPPRVTGTTTKTMVIAAAENYNEGTLMCVATNEAGEASSFDATLVVHDPAITQQPTNQTVLPGHNATFTIGVVGSNPVLTWFKDANDLNADTSGKYTFTTYTLTVGDCQVADEGAYHCVVSGGPDSDVTSINAQLDVNDPAILTHPADQVVNPHAAATFSVVVDPDSTPPISYVWFKGAVSLAADTTGKYSNVTSATLTVNDCLETDEGQFHCQVTGQHVINSNNASLTVNNPVVISTITSSPANAHVLLGSPFTITVAVAPGYTAPITGYQWFKDNVAMVPGTPPYSGVQTATLNCASANALSEGDYRVEVTNVVGMVSSGIVHIVVGGPLTIGTQPSTIKAYTGANAVFHVGVVAGLGTLHYQWYFTAAKAAVPVGTDSPDLTIVAAADKVGTYYCVVTDVRTSLTSASASLQVADHLLITVQPVGGSFNVGQALNLSVGVTGGFQPLTYAWTRDGVPVGSAATLQISPLAVVNAGDYVVTVSDNNVDTRSSQGAVVLVNAANLPVAGTLGLALLALLSACGGVATLRRKK
jgi:hypothetical protein